ncbi:hypothetical protein TNCV_2081071 [Trichonephila clavipes]|nr:hypothetical protein TNCV_2081071 [Trichonephila clavipes]
MGLGPDFIGAQCFLQISRDLAWTLNSEHTCILKEPGILSFHHQKKELLRWCRCNEMELTVLGTPQLHPVCYIVMLSHLSGFKKIPYLILDSFSVRYPNVDFGHPAL